MIENKQERSVLNTTISKNVLDDFRDYCKSVNLPMNTVLETFMYQFAQGQFSFRLIKGDKNKMELDLEK